MFLTKYFATGGGLNLKHACSCNYSAMIFRGTDMLDIFIDILLRKQTEAKTEQVLLFTSENQRNSSISFAKAAYTSGSVGKCLKMLRVLKESQLDEREMVTFLNAVIKDTVDNKSQAELVMLTKHLEEMCGKDNNYFPMFTLWHNLFFSRWFVNQEMAEKLLSSNELKLYLKVASPILSIHLLNRGNECDMRRLMQILLRHGLMDQYSFAMQALFDYYRNCDKKSCCAEIIKSSVVTNTPLRKDQYDSFISWSTTGNPNSMIPKEKISFVYQSYYSKGVKLPW